MGESYWTRLLAEADRTYAGLSISAGDRPHPAPGVPLLRGRRENGPRYEAELAVAHRLRHTSRMEGAVAYPFPGRHAVRTVIGRR